MQFTQRTIRFALPLTLVAVMSACAAPAAPPLPRRIPRQRQEPILQPRLMLRLHRQPVTWMR